MTHHPPLITVLAPIATHHTPLYLLAIRRLKIGSSVTLVKNTKTTKRTQFKKCKSPCEH
jgi:hypothetical protein